MDSLCLVTNCFGAHSSVVFVFIRNSGNKHKNNTRVSADTVRHTSTYIILYIYDYVWRHYTSVLLTHCRMNKTIQLLKF